MLKYIKIKLFYHQMKKSVYEIFVNADDVLNFITNLAVSCKDMTGEDLRKEVIHEIAKTAHDAAQKNN